MDFASWSPSHTILVSVMIVGFIIQIIVQVKVLGYRIDQQEQRQDKTDEHIEKVKASAQP